MSDKFEYKYTAPSQKEQNEINIIRNRYLPKDENIVKLEQLKKMDKKVNNIPMIIGISCGICGTLTFGLGLTFFLEWINWFYGVLFSTLGILIALIAYPIYKHFKKRLYNKYSKKILELSNELLNE